jgi:hypothetical protein
LSRPSRRGLTTHFDQTAWEEDLARSTPAGRQAAEVARRDYERSGVSVEHLRRVREHGNDGTMLPNCAKVYLPPPAGRFGMIFRAIRAENGPLLAYLAFGVRHHPRSSRRPTVYQLAHQRLHGQPPRR